jgi:hypothetical protein
LHQPKLSTCAQVPTPREVCSRLNIWNRAHLATYYKLVDGVRPYTLNPDADYGRIEVFHRAAAARPGISKRLNLVSASKKTIYKPGEVWWTDSSPNYPLNIDGNRRISHFFEEFTSVPVLSFFPDKSASSFVRSIKHLEKRLLILCPGVKLKLIRGDFDTAWATQGRPGDITTREVQDFVATRDGLQIIPIAPHSQSLNKAEPNIRRLAAFALANAVRSNLNWDLCWEDMYRGAEIQYQLGVIDGANGPTTRYTALTGRRFDLSTVAGYPGQLVWAFEQNGKASSGRTLTISGYYVCPDQNGVGGSWVRLWGTLILRLTRQFHVIDDGAIRAVLACRTSSGHPRGLYGDPDPAAYTSTVNRLLRAYRNEHDIHTYAIRHDNISGAPLELLRYAPSLLPDGTIEMVNADAPAAPTPPVPPPAPIDTPRNDPPPRFAWRIISPPVRPPTPSYDSLGALPTFYSLPTIQRHRKPPTLDDRTKQWFEGLPPETAIKVRSAGALDAASTMRKQDYISATTVGALGKLTGQRKQDVYWDLAHALIQVASPPPAHIAIVDTNEDEPPALAECSDSDDDPDPPCLAHCGDTRFASMGSSLDPTLAGIARYELLEDRAPTRTTPAATLNAAALKEARSHSST